MNMIPTITPELEKTLVYKTLTDDDRLIRKDKAMYSLLPFLEKNRWSKYSSIAASTLESENNVLSLRGMVSSMCIWVGPPMIFVSSYPIEYVSISEQKGSEFPSRMHPWQTKLACHTAFTALQGISQHHYTVIGRGNGSNPRALLSWSADSKTLKLRDPETMTSLNSPKLSTFTPVEVYRSNELKQLVHVFRSGTLLQYEETVLVKADSTAHRFSQAAIPTAHYVMKHNFNSTLHRPREKKKESLASVLIK